LKIYFPRVSDNSRRSKKLLERVVKTRFQFNGSFYRQLDGVAISSPKAPGRRMHELRYRPGCGSDTKVSVEQTCSTAMLVDLFLRFPNQDYLMVILL